MNVSSRTPEGRWNACPLCGHEVRIEPSLDFGDAPCPHCGSLLYFLSKGDEARLYDAAALVGHLLGIPGHEVTASDVERFTQDLRADSLDVVELMMELEDLTEES